MPPYLAFLVRKLLSRVPTNIADFIGVLPTVVSPRGHLTIAAIWNQSIPKNQIRTRPLLKLRSRYIVP
jgi:hypothetical protein